MVEDEWHLTDLEGEQYQLFCTSGRVTTQKLHHCDEKYSWRSVGRSVAGRSRHRSQSGGGGGGGRAEAACRPGVGAFLYVARKSQLVIGGPGAYRLTSCSFQLQWVISRSRS